jgi:hypothetical protein
LTTSYSIILGFSLLIFIPATIFFFVMIFAYKKKKNMRVIASVFLGITIQVITIISWTSIRENWFLIGGTLFAIYSGINGYYTWFSKLFPQNTEEKLQNLEEETMQNNKIVIKRMAITSIFYSILRLLPTFLAAWFLISWRHSLSKSFILPICIFLIGLYGIIAFIRPKNLPLPRQFDFLDGKWLKFQGVFYVGMCLVGALYFIILLLK